MQINDGPLAGLKIVQPRVFGDLRGYFYETHQEKRYAGNEIPPFVQDNVSQSKQHTLRGLHYQLPHSQGKLVWALRGTIWDVVVDIRRNSKTFGQWFSITLSDENHTQLYVPPGFAHGFCVVSPEAQVYYKCTDYYSPETERGIIWNDPQLNIPWPTTQPILSPKDEVYPPLCEIPHDHLFT